MSWWSEQKRSALERIKRDLETGYFDLEVAGLVNEINKDPDMYTTSSCSGRIVLYDSQMPWGASEARVIAKWHRCVELREVETLVSTYEPKATLWLGLHSPIIHVVCRTVEKALWFLSIARKIDFKHSGVISVSSKGTATVELRVFDRVEIPVKKGGSMLVTRDGLAEVVNTFNTMLSSAREVLREFEEFLKSIFSGRP